MSGEQARSGPQERGGRERLDVEARRARIFQAALAAFAAAPYEQVSMAQVARDSGSSQALVFHYFGSKADLYCAVVREAIDHLTLAQEAADAQLPAGVSARDRVHATLDVYLAHIATHPTAWATPLRGSGEPPCARAIRVQARADFVDRLGRLLGVHGWPRHTYALWGYFGFLDQACLHWVDEGCPLDQGPALIETALGALEGALGDWRT